MSKKVTKVGIYNNLLRLHYVLTLINTIALQVKLVTFIALSRVVFGSGYTISTREQVQWNLTNRSPDCCLLREWIIFLSNTRSNNQTMYPISTRPCLYCFFSFNLFHGRPFSMRSLQIQQCNGDTNP